jgi:quercetin dioxygenase-like cupin family protein
MATSTPDEIKVGEVAIRFLVEGAQSAGSVAVFEFDVPAGARVPVAHSHDGYEATIYGLEGVMTWTIEGTPTDIGPGEALCIPRGIVHHFDNSRDVGATALAIGHPRHSRPRLLPRGSGHPRRGRRRAARPRGDRSSDASPRPHPCTRTATREHPLTWLAAASVV